MESLRADSGLSRGYPETSCARGGALQGRCERVSRAGTAGCRPALALPLTVGATEEIPEPVCAQERRPCAAWKLTHPGGAGITGAGP